MAAEPLIAGIVVHWRNEHELSQLLATWPQDSRFSLCVVDNSATAGELADAFSFFTWVRAETNLGFGGGINVGVKASTGQWILLLNPDTRVDLTALETLANAAQAWHSEDPALAMIAPRLVDANGTAAQFAWQLRTLTKRRHLLGQCLFLSVPRGPKVEPASGTIVEQPAAAALLVRRDVFEQLQGFDTRFTPAWFEDVDFAHRLHAAGFYGRYLPSATIVHGGGASVPSLGFARFLRVYYRNLQRFAQARGWRVLAALVPGLVALACIARLPTLLVRKPKAAVSRIEAAAAFVQLATAALSGWRWPRNSAHAKL